MSEPSPGRNRLLACLPKAALKRLLPHLESVNFEPNDLIYEAHSAIDTVYFPTHGVLSAMTVMPDGHAIEVGNIGPEGAAGAYSFLGKAWSPNRVIVQVKGDGLRIKAADMQKAAEGDGVLRDKLLRYHSVYLAQISQSVACNGLHQIQQRCCRWLLMTHDRVGQDEFDLTHEFLAIMLGVRRSSVTEVLQRLKEQGLIDYSWGSIKILKRKKLEETCCECYALVEQEYKRLLG